MSPAPVSTQSQEVDGFLNALIESKVLDSGRARAAWEACQAECPTYEIPRLAEFLVGRGLLTAFQAESAVEGDAGKLLLGPYLLLEPLGAGHLGSAFLALHRGDRRRFALKVLPIRSLWKVLGAKKHADEFRRLGAHPALVPLADIDTAKGSHYMAWPFVEGETLEAMIGHAGPLPGAEACRIFAEVAEGLALCHENGLYHGLLNPGNLMLGRDGRARILDLGIGAILAENFDDESLLDTLSSANSALDSMEFCAPETIADPAVRTPAADIYSLGCTLYATLAGASPFPGGSVVDKMIAHQTRMPAPLRTIRPTLSADLELLLDAMMRKAPEQRPSMRDVKETLEAIAVDIPVEPPSTVSLGKVTLGFDKLEALFGEASSPDTPLGNAPDADRALGNPEIVAAPYLSSEGLIDFDVPGEVYGSGPPASHRGSTPRDAIGHSTPAPKPMPRTVERGSSFPELQLPDSGKFRALGLAPIAAAPKPETPAPGSKKNWEPLPAPVNWAAAPARSDAPAARPALVLPPPPQFLSALARGLRKQVLFWKPSEDTIQLSIFGAPEIAPGQRVNFLVYAHSPEIYSNVTTLCRAMRPDAELLGAGYVEVPVRRGVDVSLHMALTHAGVAKSIVKFTWIGQTQPRTFEIFVPWESPAGLTSGVVTAGIDNKMVASIPLHFVIPSRQM